MQCFDVFHKIGQFWSLWKKEKMWTSETFLLDVYD